jgi:transglutaminase-like putative cysteine protease
VIAAGLLLALVAAGASPHLAVSQKLTLPPRLTVGDRFEVALDVTSPSHSLVTGPLADSAGAFVVVGEQRVTRIRADHDEATYKLSVAGFKSGRQRLPGFVFIVSSGERRDTLRTDTASVNIASVLPANMKDIHGLAPPETFPNLLLWLVPAGLVLLALFAWLARRLYRRYRKLQELAAAPLSPWEEALAALDAAPWREWLAEGEAKRYSYTLSQILKRYIERRFEFDAVEQTTTELLASMRARRLPMRDELTRFFTWLDLAKYAKSVPPADEAEAAIAQVREFVRKTTPSEPAVPSAPLGAGPAPATGSA